ncbi:prepilin-type N-terminal cleavage/methylation domain-containing protein [Paenisporosarcina macmurdoensis]|uniref:Prepilin-type N-terminal cleavage/methylation domain-containing protein n=1 Tax=Paenisporosarcina macmurdoensis TaxID=212659 RepID=A0ABW1L7F5_9BACL
MGLNNKGYSLIELLLVLTIVMIISSSAIYFNNRYVEKQTFELFYNQLKLDVRHVQMLAITEERYMKLVFFETGGSRYIGRKSVFDAIFERPLPPGYHWSSSSTLKEIAFQPNGTVEKFGTFIFITPDGLKTVRVFIGKGRMVLE